MTTATATTSSSTNTGTDHPATVRPDQPVSFAAKAALLPEQWTPRVVAELNDIQFKVVRIEGDFLWHDHADTDEAFLVLDGVLRIDFRDRQVTVRPGELFVVPRGVEHKPYAESEVRMVLIEPRGVVNTGGLEANERTQANDIWI
ncbi:MAG: cupin domain-containing protein [Burkholderiaceae bacterium]